MMQSKDWLIISLFTFITVFAWIVSDVYHAAVNSTITEVEQRLIVHLDPKINAATLDQIRTHVKQ